MLRRFHSSNSLVRGRHPAIHLSASSLSVWQAPVSERQPSPCRATTTSLCAPLLLTTHRQHQQQQVRWNWQMVLRKRWDRKQRKFLYGDFWGEMVNPASSFPEAHVIDEDSGRPVTLLERHAMQPRHVKRTEQKRRIASRKEYRRSVKRVEDLTKYIVFTTKAAKEEEKVVRKEEDNGDKGER